MADIDTELLAFKRQQQTAFRQNEAGTENTVIEMEIPEPMQNAHLDRHFSQLPFLPDGEADRAAYCREVLRCSRWLWPSVCAIPTPRRL